MWPHSGSLTCYTAVNKGEIRNGKICYGSSSCLQIECQTKEKAASEMSIDIISARPQLLARLTEAGDTTQCIHASDWLILGWHDLRPLLVGRTRNHLTLWTQQDNYIVSSLSEVTFLSSGRTCRLANTNGCPPPWLPTLSIGTSITLLPVCLSCKAPT